MPAVCATADFVTQPSNKLIVLCLCDGVPQGPGLEGAPPMLQAVRALYEYKAKAPQELSFPADSLLFVHRSAGTEGWWEGEYLSTFGLIPNNVIEVRPVQLHMPPMAVILKGRSDSYVSASLHAAPPDAQAPATAPGASAGQPASVGPRHDADHPAVVVAQLAPSGTREGPLTSWACALPS